MKKASKMTTIRELFELSSSVQPMPNTFLTGVELEIENIAGSTSFPGYHTETDGSLRNNGMEFISYPAEKTTQIVHFNHLHKHIKYGAGGSINAFTERTSIHVHVNALDLTTEQAKNLVMWYALFEPVFFTMVDKKRINSIFCVPLDQTVLPASYCKPFKTMAKGWSKYTAFNLLPITTQGTIEFRHMHGHNDPVLFEEWLTLIENLWKFSKDNVANRHTLKKESFIRDAYDTIFAGTRAGKLGTSVHTLVENNLIDLKLSML